MTIKVYLADLTHTGKGIATEAMPLNIGLLKSYAQKVLGKQDFQIELFKYPENLIQAMKDSPPDILGCSNYSWNHYLGLKMFEIAKVINPKCLTIFGGTNYPFTKDKQQYFLKKLHHLLDMNVFYEGEQAFVEILKRYSTHRDDIFDSSIPGVHFYKNDEFYFGEKIERMKSLDEIPSPYASGILDQFFDGKLTPLIETARGCPFRCNFCNAGNEYFNNVEKFSDKYVQEELTYIAKKASESDVGHMTLTDNNFGMIPRDATTTQVLKELQSKYQWPISMTAWTGKNSKQKVIQATRELRETLSISMSVQALDDQVMKNIERDNIRFDDYNEIANELNEQGRPQHAELIIPLPGETWESHFEAVKKLIDTNIRSMQVHTLQILWGTPYKDNDKFIKKWGYQDQKYRIVPMDFGIYDSHYVFDIETVAVNTNSMSFEEYLKARKLILFVELVYNGGVFELIRKYLSSIEIKISEWIEYLFNHMDSISSGIQDIVDSFLEETQSELWDSDIEIIEYYSKPENYQKLLSGEAGGNVLYKHKSLIWLNTSQELIEFVFRHSADFLESLGHPISELDSLKIFTQAIVQDSYHFDLKEKIIERELYVDIPKWIEDGFENDLSHYRQNTPISIRFEMSDQQIKFKEDGKRRYGEGFQGMVKLLQRVQGADIKFIRKAYKFNH